MVRRNTWQREAVREALGTSEGFVSAQALHAHLRETGIGLATVYRALADLAADAERAKANSGLIREAYPPEAMAAAETVIRVTDDLLNSIRNTLAFYRNTRPNDPINSLVLSGGGSRLRGFPAAVVRRQPTRRQTSQIVNEMVVT